MSKLKYLENNCRKGSLDKYFCIFSIINLMNLAQEIRYKSQFIQN